MVDYNLMALLISIVENSSVEKSFYLLEKALQGKNVKNYMLSESEKKSIFNLINEGLSYSQVARILNSNALTVRQAYLNLTKEGKKNEK